MSDDKKRKDSSSSLKRSDSKRKGKKKERNANNPVYDELPAEISNSEEENETTLDLIGYVEMKKDKKFKPCYTILIGGSLYWYRNVQDPEPDGSCDMKGSTISTAKGVGKKSHVFQIKNGDKTYEGAVGNEKELKKWVDGLKKATKLDHVDAPVKEKGKKQSTMTRAKKNIAGNLAGSSFGKGIIKKVINDETAALLVCVRRIVKKDSGAKKADEIERNIIKLAVKAYLLVEKKKLRGEDFLVADEPLREAFELLTKCYNGRGRVRPEVLKDAFKRVETMLKSAETTITNLLAPHLTPKNMFRISTTFGHLGSAEFLSKVFQDEAIDSDLEKLIDAMEYYTQFHY